MGALTIKSERVILNYHAPLEYISLRIVGVLVAPPQKEGHIKLVIY